MTYMMAQPQLLTSAAADVEGIRWALTQANAAAAGPTTSLVAAAADEVSTAAAKLFGGYALEYQSVIGHVTAFHEEFVRTLAAAGTAYAGAEAVNTATISGALNALRTPIQSLLGGGAASTVAAGGAAVAPAALADPFVALIMGGSGTPIPPPDYLQDVAPYIPGMPTQLLPLNTPEGLYPLTAIKDLPLNTSVANGVQILDNALFGPQGLITLGNNVNVLGYSQSAVVSSLEMRNLQALGSPNTDNLAFTLLGNPMAPNGGLLSRFPGLSLPALGLDFYGGTPSNTGYELNQYTLLYDGYADFPQYPLNLLADLNAFAGIQFVHGDYPDLDPNNLPAGYNLVQLPVSPGNNGLENYYMITYPGLPILEPLRAIPVIGNPLADLVEPNLTYLVNLGYGDPNYGYSTGYADVTTPFGLLPPIDPVDFAGAMVNGTQQGVTAFVNDISAIPATLPSLSLPDFSQTGGSSVPSTLPAVPTVTNASINGFIDALQAANTNIANAITNVSADTYAALLPTADIINTVLTTVPSYNVNLFLDGIQQFVNGDPVGLINAIGYPIAADVAVAALAGGFEVIVLADTAQEVVGDIVGAF